MRQHLSTGMLGLFAKLFHECVELDGVVATGTNVGQILGVGAQDDQMKCNGSRQIMYWRLPQADVIYTTVRSNATETLTSMIY
jgi:hypothetical protein